MSQYEEPWLALGGPILDLSRDLMTILKISRDTPAPGPSLVTQQALAGDLERSPGPTREPRYKPSVMGLQHTPAGVNVVILTVKNVFAV